MSLDADLRIALLRAARAAVSSPQAVPEALDALVTCLRPHFPISRVSLRVLDVAEDRLQICGVWSDGETAVRPGVTIPIAATSFLELEREGRSLLRRFDELRDRPSLLDQVLHDEGLQCWIVIPLRRGLEILGTLNLAGRSPDAFAEADLPFFDDLATEVGSSLLAIAGGFGS